MTTAPPTGPASRCLAGEFVQLARLGGPIALVQFGMMAMGFVDVAMLGHYDARALAAMSLGNTLTWAAMVFCMGVLTAADPLLSQAVGAGDRRTVTLALLRALALATLLIVPSAGLLLPADLWLRLLGQADELVGRGADYAQISTLGIAPVLWFQVLRSLLSSHSRTAPQVAAIAIANVANALLD